MLSILLAALSAPVPAARPAPVADAPAWVELTPGGGSVVRVVTRARTCPVLDVDGRTRAMRLRAAPAQLPERSNKALVSAPADFPSRVCELALGRGVRQARLAGRRLPVPRARVDRIVVIGDTGCRLKAAESAWQGCNDRAQWPFAAIAARAAALHPDLVLHVGDYLYRENPCPADQLRCAATPWGYGEAGWRADFLNPAAPLLRVAPWIMVRGNHEECARAGQGWWRLIDPHALVPGAGCQDAGQDATGNHTDPYAVDLGGGTRIIVADLVALSAAMPADRAVAALFSHDMAMIDDLSAGARTSFVAVHFPFNPVLFNRHDPAALVFAGKPMDAMTLPPLRHVRAVLSGHIHTFQVARFSDRPIQVITGFSGTQEDAAAGPRTMAEAAGKAGADRLRAVTTIPATFGYALMTRRAQAWRLTAYAADGTKLGDFAL